MPSIQCHTNIDCAKQLGWPDRLPERPVVGDLIRSTSSTSKKHIELQIYRCTWVRNDRTYEWYIDVELHLPTSRFQNITAFENWINKGE